MVRRLITVAAIALVVAAAVRWWPRSPRDRDGALRSYATRAGPGGEEGPSTYPSDWAWIRRTAPWWRADAGAFRQATEQARAMRAAAGSGFRLALQPVDPAGPTNVGGRISDIAWDPTDPSVVYAGAATGGVFKSTDGGTNWTPIADDLPNLDVGDLAVDPSSPQTVWLGTGEANGGHNNFPGGGMYRSGDGGATWTFMGLDGTASIARVVVDPTDGRRVFVAAQGSYFGPNSERGVYRTTDGGATWQLVLSVTDSTAATDLVMDPSDPDRLLAAMWERVRYPNGGTHLYGPTSGVWRSLDGGDTWAPLGPANGLPNAALQHVGRIGLALCPQDPHVAYALINDGSNPIGLWRTADFGTTWVNRDGDHEIAGAGFSWYFGQVRVAPDDCDRVYAQDMAFYRSDDGGITFPIKYGSGAVPNFHVDHHALAFDPSNPDHLIEGNDGGLNYSTNRGTNWGKVTGLPVNQFYEINVDLLNPSRLYGGTQDNGTLRTLTGAPSGWSQIYGSDGFYVNVDPTNSSVIYAESQNGGLVKSVNGGGSWSSITPGGPSERRNWSTPVRLDPVTPGVVYYGTQRVWRSDNGGSSWSAVSGDLTDWVSGAVLGTITTIGVSPADHDVVWAGTDDGNVWRGVRGGGGTFAWTDVTQPNLPDRWVTRVIPHPTDSLAAWATFNGLKWIEPEGHVFATTDGGDTWNDITSNLPDAPVNALAVDPANPLLLFVGTDLGAYYSDDGGGIWNYLSPDLPMVSVYDLAIHPGAHRLAIGTHGRSMYTMDLTTLLAAGGNSRTPGATLFQNAPNPFRDGTRIAFVLPRPGSVRLQVFDAAGRRLRTLVDGARSAGRHEAVWDGRDDGGRPVRAGVYRCRLLLPDGEPLSRGMVVLR